MGRAWAIAGLVCALAGCGSGFPTGGSCTSDSQCRLCTICACEKAYSVTDIGSATCQQIAASETCPYGVAPDCESGPLQALCVSGHCSAVTHLVP